MLRKVIAASLVLVLSVGVMFAEEIRGVITKVDGNKVSFFKTEGKGKEAKKVGEEITLPVATDVKVVSRGKKGQPGDELEGGLKNKRFSNIPENGMPAMLITDDGNKKITEIRVFGRGKKKN